MTFGQKNIVGSRIRTYEPRFPRCEDPVLAFRKNPKELEAWTSLISPAPLSGRTRFLGSGALDHSAIPTHVDLQILQEAYLLLG